MNANDHYVPQFILRQFQNADNQLHVYDKWEDRIFVSSTRNVASENGFYDLMTPNGVVPLEPALCEIETIALGPLNALISTKSFASITHDEKAHIALFLTVQMLRTRANRDMLAQMDEGIRRALPQKNLTESQLPEGTLYRDADELKSASIKNLRIAQEMFHYLIDKEWCLNSTSDRAPFFLSDNPVVRRNIHPPHPLMGNNGINSRGIQIYMPLTPKLTLCLFCPSIWQMFRDHRKQHPDADIPFLDSIDAGVAFEIPSESVTYCNSLQVAHSSRFVFSPNGDFSLAKEMLASNPELRKPTHILVQ